MATISAVLASITLVLVIVSMLLGLLGTLVPMLPGLLLVWLALLTYALVDGFQVITPAFFATLSFVALFGMSSDLWLPLLGARASGASWRSTLYGTVGALVGFFVGTLLGSIVGYAVGVLVAEYQKHQDWNLAFKASLGGLAGMGVSKLVQLGCGVLIFAAFITRVLGG